VVKIKKSWFIALFIVIVFAGFFLRFYQLDTKLLHHDENVLEEMYVTPIAEGKSPDWNLEQHGMLPNYFTAFFVKIFGLSVFSIRFATALFGSMTILLLYFLRKHIGYTGVLVSSAFLAFSPTFVYYSRQYTTYPFYIFFLLLFIIVGLNIIEKFTLAGFYSLFILSAILFNINEIFLIFLFLLFAYVYIFHGMAPFKEIRKAGTKHIILAVLVFLLLFTFIHTCFFTNTGNIIRLKDAGLQLAGKSTNKMNQPFSYYLQTIFPIEIGLLVMAAIGCICRRKNEFSRFLLFWSLTSLIIFSIINYKVKWMLPIVILPLILLCGSAASGMLKRYGSKKRWIIIMICALLAVTAFYCIQQNFMIYNPDTKNVLGQMETGKDTEGIISKINAYKENDAHILVTLNNYWPLPFYLHNHNLTWDETTSQINISSYPQYDIFIGFQGQFTGLREGDKSTDFIFKKDEEWAKTATIVFREKQ